MGRFRSLFRRRERERQLDRELRFHLEEQTRENLAAGMDPVTARRRALLDFGGVDQIKEACRDATGASWGEAWCQDVKFGLRSLRKAPGFTLIALATLAIGIGFTAAIYSYLDGILFRPSDYPDADRLVWIYETAPNQQQLISTANFLDLTAESTMFEYTAAHRWGWVTLTGAGLPAQVYCERVGIHFFDIFKVTPQLGRLFATGDDQPGRDHVVIISHGFWRSQFAADPRIVGRPVRLDGEAYTVIGVLPKGVTDSTPAKMWRPLAFSAQEQSREQRWLLAWGKLKSGISSDQARVQLETISRRLTEAYPSANKGWKLQLQPALGDRASGEVKQSLYLLMGSVGMVMLIACANLANLTLARGAAREREAAVRAALGAGRGRLVRQFLTESLLLSLGGGLLGVGVAYASLAWLKRLVPGDYIPIANVVELDGRVLLFIATLAVAAGLIFGLYPALKASRPDLRHALNQGGLGASSGRRHQRFRQALVVVEVALAVVLLFGSGLLIRSFAKLAHVETGFDSTDVITAGLPLDLRRLSSADALKAYLRKLTDRANALPGVRDVALTSSIPMRGLSLALPFSIGGETPPDPSHRPFCYIKSVTPSYFRLLGLRLLRGRLLDGHDVAGAAPVALINETMAKRYFADGEALGRMILIPQIAYPPAAPGPMTAWEVVGVIADERLGGLATDFALPGLYLTTEQAPVPTQALLVRTVGDPAAVRRAIPAAITDVNPDQPVKDVQMLDDIKSASIGKQRLNSTLLGIFAGVALFLSALGLYGVISYSVAQRTREIGIRTALGATSGNILWLTFRHGLLVTSAGLMLGLVGAIGVGQILASMLFEVERFDLATLAAIIALQAAIALLACFVPARRALEVSPLVALRCE